MGVVMELGINKNNISLTKIAVDGFSEEKVDFDIIIPDYCASAGKILKCEITPVITSKSIESDRLIIQGVCFAVVVYSDENTGVVRSISESCEFNQSYPIKESLENYKINLKLRPSNVVCRLQNSRRISIKSMVGIAIKVLGNCNHELINGFSDSDIETMYDNIKYSAYINSGNSDIHINSEQETKHSVSEIIKSNCNVNITDIKVIKDKTIIKGECKVEILYTFGDEISDIENCICVIPFSDVIDITGADEGQVCDCIADVVSVRCNVGNTSEQNIITIEIDAAVSASVYRNDEIRVLQDVYSKRNQLSVSNETLTFESLEKVMKFSSFFRDNMAIDISDAVIDEVYAKPIIKNISYVESALLVEGDLIVSACMHNDSEYKMYEKLFQFKITEPLLCECTKLRCEASVICSDIDSSATSFQNLDFECDLVFKILVFAKKTTNVISNVEIESPKDNINDSKIYLYYADKGEKLWDIAKKYCSSVDAIKRDNSIECDCLDKSCMLLISEK